MISEWHLVFVNLCSIEAHLPMAITIYTRIHFIRFCLFNRYITLYYIEVCHKRQCNPIPMQTNKNEPKVCFESN